MEAMALRSSSPSADLPWKVYGSKNQYSPEFSERSGSRKGFHMYNVVVAKTFISRSVRARRRRAFLNTYTLSSLDNSTAVPKSKSGRVKRVTNKIKSVLVSAFDGVRNSSIGLTACTSKSAICPSSAIQSD